MILAASLPDLSLDLTAFMCVDVIDKNLPPLVNIILIVMETHALAPEFVSLFATIYDDDKSHSPMSYCLVLKSMTTVLKYHIYFIVRTFITL